MANRRAEVAGSTESLVAFIDRDDMPRPQLMNFQQWLVWRRDYGRRPHAQTDGELTTMKEEAELWRSTMLYLYGENWSIDLAIETAQRRAEAEGEDALEPEGVVVPAEKRPAASWSAGSFYPCRRRGSGLRDVRRRARLGIRPGRLRSIVAELPAWEPGTDTSSDLGKVRPEQGSVREVRDASSQAGPCASAAWRTSG